MEEFNIPHEYSNTIIGTILAKGTVLESSNERLINYTFPFSDPFTVLISFITNKTKTIIALSLGFHNDSIWSNYILPCHYGAKFTELVLNLMEYESNFDNKFNNLDASTKFSAVYLYFKIRSILQSYIIGKFVLLTNKELFMRNINNVGWGFEHKIKAVIVDKNTGTVIDGIEFCSKRPVRKLILAESNSSDLATILQKIFDRLNEHYYDCPGIYTTINRKMVKRAQ